ncbi:hypothetical protein BT69DRAFT_1333997 [Atractiella rhizophila]|nr:hypothetical protein BT69DRAFT_1333997 [Atractiella rhizophila]
MEKDEEVDRLKLQLDKVRKAHLSAKPTNPTSMDRIALQPVDSHNEFSGDDWIKKPLKHIATASTRSGLQNNILNPVQVLHQLIIDEADDTVIGALPLPRATADVTRSEASLYAKSYLDTTKSIKNQTGLCKTTYLPNILHKLEADYSTVLCLGKTDWMSRVFVTSVLRNTSGSTCDNEDEPNGGVEDEVGRIVKRGLKRKGENSLKAMVTNSDIVINLNILTAFVEDGVLPLDHVNRQTSRSVAELATKRLLTAVLSAEPDIHLPTDADEDCYTSDLQNNPRGDTLGHNSLRQEMLFRLKRWENGKDVRLAEDLRNSMVRGEYSKALQAKNLDEGTPTTPNKTIEEKGLQSEIPSTSGNYDLSPSHDHSADHTTLAPAQHGFWPANQAAQPARNDHDFPPPPPPPANPHFSPPQLGAVHHGTSPPCDITTPQHLPNLTHNHSAGTSQPVQPIPVLDIWPAPLVLVRGKEVNEVSTSKKKRGRAKKKVKDTEASLPPEEITKLHEDVEKLRPLLDMMDMPLQIEEAKKMAKDNGWKAEHWKKMLQYQAYNKEVVITKFNLIDKKVVELLSNIKGNELADAAANSATDPETATGHIVIPRSPATLKAIITTNRFTPKEASSPPSGKHHHSLSRRLSPDQTFDMLKEMPRAQASIFVQLRSGHTSINNYLHRIGASEEPSCNFCGMRDTVTHLFFECEEHEDERKKLRSRLRKKDIKFRSLSDLLSEPEAMQAVWEFIRKSGKFSLWIKRAQRVLDRRKEEREKRAESRGEEQEEREEWED